LQLGSRTSSGSFTSSTCVSFILFGILELSGPFQTELAIDTHFVVGDTHTVVTDTRTAVTDTYTVVADTHTMVADIHRSVLTVQEGASGQNHSVCFESVLSKVECLPPHRLEPG
jgi:hypothetical protein